MRLRIGLGFTVLVLSVIAHLNIASAGDLPGCSALSIIPNVLVSPNGTLNYTVVIVSASGPVPNALVTLDWSQIPGLGCWCPNQPIPPPGVVTDSGGRATFNIKGGGCVNHNELPPGQEGILLSVNGIPCKYVGQVSPDYTPGTGSTCEVTLSDAVTFTQPLATGMWSFCHDLNSDLVCGLTDAVILTPLVAGAAGCE